MGTLRRPLIAVLAVCVSLIGGGVVGYAATGGFSDVPDDHLQAADIARAVELGWYAGYPDGTFKPDRLLSTDQAVTVFGRAFPDGVSRADLATILVGGTFRLNNLRTSSTTTPAGQSSSNAPQEVGTWTGFEGEGVDGAFYGYWVDAISYTDSHLVSVPSLYLRCGRGNTAYDDIFIITPWYLPANEDKNVLVRARFSHQDEPIIGYIWSSEESDGSALVADFDSGAIKMELTDLDDDPTSWFIEIIDNVDNRERATFELSYTATAISNLACFS